MAPIYPADLLMRQEVYPRPVETYHQETYDRITPARSKFKGKGKTLLITGGATGIGFEISKAFAEAGISRIALISRRQDVLDEAKKALQTEYPKVNIEPHSASVGDYSAISDVVKKIGQIDVVVLSAAYGHEHQPVQEISLKGMETSYQTNVLGNWNLIKSVLAERNDRRCIILNVSSWATYRALPQQAPYATSKAAFTQMISEFAREYAEEDVRFVSFHPGAIWTDITARTMSKDIFDGWEDARLPGHFAVWLASHEAKMLHGRFVWAQWDVDELIALENKLAANPYFLKIGLEH